jgi:LPXTG-motif cell wall-anchored protein
VRWLWPVIFGVEGLVLLVGGFIGRRRRNNAIRIRSAGLELRPTRAPGLSQTLAFVLMFCGLVGLVACVWSVVYVVR